LAEGNVRGTKKDYTDTPKGGRERLLFSSLVLHRKRSTKLGRGKVKGGKISSCHPGPVDKISYDNWVRTSGPDRQSYHCISLSPRPKNKGMNKSGKKTRSPKEEERTTPRGSIKKKKPTRHLPSSNTVYYNTGSEPRRRTKVNIGGCNRDCKIPKKGTVKGRKDKKPTSTNQNLRPLKGNRA